MFYDNLPKPFKDIIRIMTVLKKQQIYKKHTFHFVIRSKTVVCIFFN